MRFKKFFVENKRDWIQEHNFLYDNLIDFGHHLMHGDECFQLARDYVNHHFKEDDPNHQKLHSVIDYNEMHYHDTRRFLQSHGKTKFGEPAGLSITGNMIGGLEMDGAVHHALGLIKHLEMHKRKIPNPRPNEAFDWMSHSTLSNGMDQGDKDKQDEYIKTLEQDGYKAPSGLVHGIRGLGIIPDNTVTKN